MSNRVRCAIYTRKSTEEGLDQEFNSLDAQREACEAYIQSQKGLGWRVIAKRYDDGGISGGTLERPSLKSLLADVEAGKIDLIVVYKVDRLTRSLTDFSKIIEKLDAKEISFVSVTQQFNTANSMGRLTLNMLLSFAQFEREVTAERIRDKIAASKRKGMWMGGQPPLGYDVCEKKLIVNKSEAEIVRQIFDLYLKLKSVRKLKTEVDQSGYKTKRRIRNDKVTGGKAFTRGHLYYLLRNPLYVGEVSHKGAVFPGQHEAIIDRETWNNSQALLTAQAPQRTSNSNIDHRCMLTGLVFDETGDRLCPTYAKKDGRSHPYYISKRLNQSAKDQVGGWRLPAKALEQAIVSAVLGMLKDEKQWIKLLINSDLTTDDYRDVRTEIASMQSKLTSGRRDEVREVINRIIHRIKIEPGKASIVFAKAVLMDAESVNESTPGQKLSVPFQTRRRGVETRIILGSEISPDVNTDHNLISAVKRSFKWWRLLTEEDGWSIQKLAALDGVDASDVTRFLPLAFLSPNIVKAILEGRQPVDLNLERFKKMGVLPMDWEGQAKVLGFAEMIPK